MPFTIGISVFGMVVVAAIAVGAVMLVSESALEAESLGPASNAATNKVYGAKHAGVGFANYLVGNEVKSFWQNEMGHSAPSDPFAAALGVKKGQAPPPADGAPAAPPPPSAQDQADQAQSVDEEGHKIISTSATDDALRCESARACV